MSAPYSPGRRSKPRLTGSTLTIASAPRAWIVLTRSSMSSSCPKTLGYCRTTAAVSPGDGQCHEQRLADGRASVVEAGVGDIHPGQLGNEGLIFKGGLKGPLTCLSLVRGVGRVKFAP